MALPFTGLADHDSDSLVKRQLDGVAAETETATSKP